MSAHHHLNSLRHFMVSAGRQVGLIELHKLMDIEAYPQVLQLSKATMQATSAKTTISNPHRRYNPPTFFILGNLEMLSKSNAVAFRGKHWKTVVVLDLTPRPRRPNMPTVTTPIVIQFNPPTAYDETLPEYLINLNNVYALIASAKCWGCSTQNTQLPHSPAAAKIGDHWAKVPPGNLPIKSHIFL